MAYGGVMPLYAVLAREYFGQAVMGTVIGAATMLSSLGMALGPLGGGFIYDTFGDYTWLYIGSAFIAFAAVAIVARLSAVAERAGGAGARLTAGPEEPRADHEVSASAGRAWSQSRTSPRERSRW